MNTSNRREFLKVGSEGLTGLAALGVLGCSRSQEETLPNVLVIYTDEHSLWTLGAYGSDLVGTPHLDSIAREGAVFDNFFTNSALCTPSRACFITGQYPQIHGCYTNNIPLKQDQVTLVHRMQQAGYETGFAGKWHLDGDLRPGWVRADRSMGFEDHQWMYNRGHWKSIVEKPADWPNNRSVTWAFGQTAVAEEPDGRPNLTYKVGEGHYVTDWLADKAIEFIRRPREQPFFYMLGIPDPHTPWTVRQPYDSMYKPADMPVPPTFSQKDLPQWAKVLRDNPKQGAPLDDPNREQTLRRRKALYCGEVKCIDDNVGRILDCLRQENILDDTLVIFSCDHGQYMGEHGIYFKNHLYETAFHLPLLMRWPKKLVPGRRIEQVVSTVDFQPTLLGLLGLPGSGQENGHDASPLLRGEEIPWENEAFLHHSTLAQAGIFTPDWELGLVKEGGSILFDRRQDPDQVHNLFDDAGHREVVNELTERVIAHNRRLGSPELEWLADFVRGG